MNSPMSAIRTPATDPDHPVIGRSFRGWDGKTYLCESYDPTCGYWMTAVDGSRRTNVSERAIGRTYHRIEGTDP